MTGSSHILIVDDDSDIRDLLGKFLRQHGFEASLAKDGSEMQAILLKQAVDLVILDIMMPGEDGLTLCCQIRTNSTIPPFLCSRPLVKR